MPRHRSHQGKRDKNHAAIRDGLKALGFKVWDTSSSGDGFPDLIVAGWDNVLQQVTTVLVEIKSPGGKLTEAESAFFDYWPAALRMVAYDIQDVLDYFGRA